MFRLTWNCYQQNKETGEIEPFIGLHRRNSAVPSWRLNITGIANRPEVTSSVAGQMTADTNSRYPQGPGKVTAIEHYLGRVCAMPGPFMKTSAGGASWANQNRLIADSVHMPEHTRLIASAKVAIRGWPASVQQPFFIVFSERGLGQLADSELMPACIVLLSRIDRFAPLCQRYIIKEIVNNITRLSLCEKYYLYYFVMDLLNDGSFLCPTCHYLADIMDCISGSMLSQ